MCTVWQQVHVLGQFKAGEKPNRAELESILKAGGASLVDAAEPRVDLAVMHSSTPRDNPKVKFEKPYSCSPRRSIRCLGILHRILLYKPKTKENNMAHGS